ncbi:hypothetical protein KC19_3G257500 [Ceratodon purpureus]|uniref:Protein kinase domain-containing protein n=1 Tax=Ceratodon purpureus TaxID=3225 RepID=A0A8T0IPH5_CERPU|nr:hypothetical protein KC19_3G257500 [Ceratodon purpureus]
MALRFVLVIHLLLLFSSSVRAVNFHNDTYPGMFLSSSSDLYAMKQLWNTWNSTPDLPNNLAGWNPLENGTDMTPCVPTNPWRGVYCNAVTNSSQSSINSTVWDLGIVSLVLANVSLQGTIPAGIGNLSNLVTISLTDNRGLTGNLPMEFENMYSLFEIDLHGNSITGGIPAWNQQAFLFLQTLNIADNKMEGLLPRNRTISFRAVQTFNLSYNYFSQENSLGDLFFYFHKAVSMDFSHNNFSGVLPYLTNVTEEGTNLQITGPLSYLDFSSNSFNGSLPNMNGHQALRFFNVSQNLLSGELDPVMLSNVSTLETMDLSHNQFTGFISNLGGLTGLQHLDLSYNKFNPGPFPNWTTSLIYLQTLSLRGLSLNGSVPSSVLADFKSLHTLALDDNNLTGTLDLDTMLAVPNRIRNLQLVSLTNNRISKVAYSGRVGNITVKFNMLGNPYCDNSTSGNNDLTRCVCEQVCVDTPSHSDRKVIIIASVIGGSALAVVITIYSLLFWRSKKEGYKLLLGAEQKFAEYEVKPTIYTYSELQVITRSFSMKLGQGAFGAVYKGTLSTGIEVAVKQLYTKSEQSLDDFLNEIVLVTAVKHRNLVKLKGCCIRKDQRLLVYEFVENGDLDQFLFGIKNGDQKKDWNIRRNICYEVAEGIQYLHFANQPKIIHRDIKACNILLDKNLAPKIADFGLALLYPDEGSHIMTIHVAGTRGYLAPEYAQLGLLSEKVDVFSYGVLLLEIVSGRRNMEPKSPEDQFYLPDWAWILHSEGRIKELIDPTLDQQNHHLHEREAIRILSIALLCVHRSGERRPDMKSVVAMLHGGMDAEVAKLVVEHESDRFSSSRAQLQGSLGHSDSSSGVSSVMSKGYAAPRGSAPGTTLENQDSLSPLNAEKEQPSDMWALSGSGLGVKPI